MSKRRTHIALALAAVVVCAGAAAAAAGGPVFTYGPYVFLEADGTVKAAGRVSAVTGKAAEVRLKATTKLTCSGPDGVTIRHSPVAASAVFPKMGGRVQFALTAHAGFRCPAAEDESWELVDSSVNVTFVP